MFLTSPWGLHNYPSHPLPLKTLILAYFWPGFGLSLILHLLGIYGALFFLSSEGGQNHPRDRSQHPEIPRFYKNTGQERTTAWFGHNSGMVTGQFWRQNDKTKSKSPKRHVKYPYEQGLLGFGNMVTWLGYRRFEKMKVREIHEKVKNMIFMIFTNSYKFTILDTANTPKINMGYFQTVSYFDHSDRLRHEE